MAASILPAEPPLNELDREVLQFWRLKNRYDHVHRFNDNLRSLCAELGPTKVGNPITEEIQLEVVAAESNSIALDASLNREHTREEDLAVSPELDSPVIELLQTDAATNIESPLHSDSETVTLSPSSEESSHGKPQLSPASSPCIDLDNEAKPAIDPDMWHISHKKSQFFCRLVSSGDGSCLETLGPFETLEAARAAIGLTAD